MSYNEIFLALSSTTDNWVVSQVEPKEISDGWRRPEFFIGFMP